MGSNFDSIIAGFRNSSSRIYAQLYDRFTTAVAPVNRRGDENVFQQALSRHLSDLEKQLKAEAAQWLEQYRDHSDSILLHREMSACIAYYLSEFRHRAGAL